MTIRLEYNRGMRHIRAQLASKQVCQLSKHGKQTIKQASKQASNHAGKQVSKQS